MFPTVYNWVICTYFGYILASVYIVFCTLIIDLMLKFGTLMFEVFL